MQCDRAVLNCHAEQVEGFVFVECANTPAISEAKWVLDMVADSVRLPFLFDCVCLPCVLWR